MRYAMTALRAQTAGSPDPGARAWRIHDWEIAVAFTDVRGGPRIFLAP